MLIGACEEAANRLLRLDGETMRALGALSGRIIRIELRGTGITFDVAPAQSGIRLRARGDSAPDVTVCGSIYGLIDLVRGRQTQAFRAGAVDIRGDVELGQQFQKILQQMDIDWEEIAARVVGDPLAHQLGNAVRATTSTLRAAVSVIMQDVAEYLQRERRVLPSRDDVDAFADAVDVLRADVDRLAQRVARLRGSAG